MNKKSMTKEQVIKKIEEAYIKASSLNDLGERIYKIISSAVAIDKQEQRKENFKEAQRILERYYPEIGRISITGDLIPIYKIWKEYEERITLITHK